MKIFSLNRWLRCAAALLVGRRARARRRSTSASSRPTSPPPSSRCWEPFIEDMSKQTGLKVNAFFATDYTGIIEAQRFNKIQVAWYGNKARDRGGGPRQRRGVRAVHRPARHARLLLLHHRAQDSPINNRRRHVEERQEPRLSARAIRTRPPARWCRATTCSRSAASRPKDVFKVVRPAQPRHQPAGGGEQAGRRRDQQQRGARQAAAEGSGEEQGSADHLEVAPDPERSAGVAQGPAARREGEDQDIHHDATARTTARRKSSRACSRSPDSASRRQRAAVPIRQLELAKDRKVRIESDTTLSDAEKAAKLRRDRRASSPSWRSKCQR